MVVIQSATNFKKSSVVMPVMGDRDDFEKTGFAKRRQRLDIAVDAMDEHVARWRAPSDSRATAAAPASAALA
jgi:hypothetical protein